MEEIKDNIVEMECNQLESEAVPQVPIVDSAGDAPVTKENTDDSQNLFPDSPVYEPDDDIVVCSPISLK